MNQRVKFMLVLSIMLVLTLSLAGCNRERPVTTNDRGTPAPARGTVAVPTNALTPAAIATGAGSTNTTQQTPTAPAPQATTVSPAATTATGGAAATGQPVEYTVAAGDNLAAIAARFGVTVDAIARLNNIADPNALRLGQVLKIPVASATGAASTAPTPAAPAASGTTSATVTYTVQSGDTLGRIAQRFNTTTEALVQLNGLTNPDQIKVGQQLKVPATGGATTGSTGAGQGRTHVVQRGETLGVIAKTYGVTVAEIAAANNIADADTIFVGQALIIP